MKNLKDVNPYWLDKDKWPSKQGKGVALVVGGSVEMRLVRKRVEEDLERNNIKIYELHASIWTDKMQQEGGWYLLLATETLFSIDHEDIRNKLEFVFDMCEKHRILQPKPSSVLMERLKKFGLCDVLATEPITHREQQERIKLLGGRYCPIKEIPETHCKFPTWQLGPEEAGGLPFVGFPLPDKYLNDRFLDDLFGRSKKKSVRENQAGGEKVSFNSLPLNFLLEEAVNSRRSQQERMEFGLAVCAVQLVSSRTLAPIFQHKRTLMYEDRTVWNVVETSVFMLNFLSAGGNWSREATLVHLALQYKRGVPIEELQNLQGFTFYYYLQWWERDMKQRFKTLLKEMMRLMEQLETQLLSRLCLWCRESYPAGRPLEMTIRPQDISDEIGHFLEEAMKDAAEKASKIPGCPFLFVFSIDSINGQCHLQPSRLRRVSRKLRVNKQRNTRAFKTVLQHYFGQTYEESSLGRSGHAVFPFDPESREEDRLLAAVMVLNLVLDHDSGVGRRWQLRTKASSEFPEKVFNFRKFGEISNNIHFSAVPLKFYAAGAKGSFCGKHIHVMKRFATPNMLVLRSFVVL
eukprot:Skav236002  [mRNA]  locus=scaffold348:508767:511115:+ [translate_table: standard]